MAYSSLFYVLQFFPQNFIPFSIRDRKVGILPQSIIDVSSFMPLKPQVLSGESTGLVTEQSILPEARIGIRFILLGWSPSKDRTHV